MCLEDLVGKEVYHKTYGKGIIDNVIVSDFVTVIVKFANDKLLNFIYPDAFHKHLEFTDKNIDKTNQNINNNYDFLMGTKFKNNNDEIGNVVSVEGNKVGIDFGKEIRGYAIPYDILFGRISAKDSDIMDKIVEINNTNSRKSEFGELERFHLSDFDKKQLIGFFKYLAAKDGPEIQYNFLIQAEDDDLGIDFVKTLMDLIKRYTGEPPKAEYKFEKNFLCDAVNLEKYDTIIIYKAMTDKEFYVSDNDSSNIKSTKEKYGVDWKEAQRVLSKLKDKRCFLIAPKSIVQGRIKNDPGLYYRFFRNHIYLNNMTAKESLDYFVKKMDEENILYRTEFVADLEEYFNTVYPKADLKGKKFSDDLFDWMINLSYRNQGKCLSFTKDCIPFYHKNHSLDVIDRDFESLVGLDEIKSTFHDIGMMASTVNPSKTMPYFHMLFKGNPGTGKSTVAKRIANLLSSMGVIKKNKVVEILASDFQGEYVGQTGPKVDRILEKAQDGVLFIDGAALLDPYTNSNISEYRMEALEKIKSAMDERINPVIVFSDYPDRVDELIKNNPEIKSKIGFILNFDDYSDDQLLEIFIGMCDRDGFTYEPETINKVKEKLTAFRYDDGFGNARDVETIFNQAVVECMRFDSDNKTIKPEHIVIGRKLRKLKDIENELNNLVGLKEAKRILNDQAMANKFCKETNRILPSTNNMVFVGNAGTGKTTTAKLFAEMLFSIGVTKSPKTKLVSSKDFFDSDIATKMNDICNEAMGGVLFIDEIYMLNNSGYVLSSVISVLLDLMENRRGDITFIFAGYEKEMNEFLDNNQGLKSRIPITVKFDDFNLAELKQIFIQNCDSVGLTVNRKGIKKFEDIISSEMKKENFGNGRTVRNIFEHVFRKHAVNYYNTATEADVITEKDFTDFSEISIQRNSIGF